MSNDVKMPTQSDKVANLLRRLRQKDQGGRSDEDYGKVT